MTAQPTPTPGDVARRAAVEPSDGPVGDRLIDAMVAELSARVAAVHNLKDPGGFPREQGGGSEDPGDDIAAMLESGRRLHDHLQSRLEDAAL